MPELDEWMEEIEEVRLAHEEYWMNMVKILSEPRLEIPDGLSAYPLRDWSNEDE